MTFFSKLFGKRSPSPAPPPQMIVSDAEVTQSATPTNWRTSLVHLMALERFLGARLADSGIPDYWATALKEPPQQVVRRFIAEGLLVSVPLVRVVEYCSSAADLKALAKERGLKISGRKEEVAQRLLDADPEGMAKLFKGKQVFTCSPEVRFEVERFTTQRLEALDSAVAAVRKALEAHDYRSAVETARRYRESEVHIVTPNPLAIPSPTVSVGEDVAQIETIYRIRPRILKKLAADDWQPLATVVAMGHLLGRMPTNWLPASFKGVEQFEHEVTFRMMQFHLGDLDRVARMRSAGIAKAKVLACGGDAGSCEACQKMAGKVRKLDALPELPYEHCTCRMGCRCVLVAEV